MKKIVSLLVLSVFVIFGLFAVDTDFNLGYMSSTSKYNMEFVELATNNKLEGTQAILLKGLNFGMNITDINKGESIGLYETISIGLPSTFGVKQTVGDSSQDVEVEVKEVFSSYFVMQMGLGPAFSLVNTGRIKFVLAPCASLRYEFFTTKNDDLGFDMYFGVGAAANVKYFLNTKMYVTGNIRGSYDFFHYASESTDFKNGFYIIPSIGFGFSK